MQNADDEQDYTTNEMIIESDDSLANSIHRNPNQNTNSINMHDDAQE